MHIKVSTNTGTAILVVGLALLSFAFAMACIHLHSYSPLPPVSSLFAPFGELLSPLIEAGVRAVYLGLMGWIAAKVTAKGANILMQAQLKEKHSPKQRGTQ